MRILTAGKLPVMEQFRKVVTTDEQLKDFGLCVNYFGMDDWREISRNPFFYDVLFIDVELGAEQDTRMFDKLMQLREKNPDLLIVGITGGNYLSVKMLELKFFGVLHSGFDRSEVRKMFLCLKEQVDDLRERRGPKLSVFQEGYRYLIPAGQIYYGEKCRNGLVLMTCLGQFFYRKKMDEFEMEMPRSFCRCSSSCFVNFNHVFNVAQQDIRMINGEIIRVSRSYRKSVKQYIETHFCGSN